jgi:polar amino acid transport system substrate-binding protein
MHAGLPPFVGAGADCDELGRLTGAPAPPPRRAVDGRVVCGFDLELVAGAARALDVELEVTLVDRFDDLLPALRAGKVDVVASALTRTLDRAVTVAFSEPYFTSGLEVLVREPQRWPTLESLRAGRVAVKRATTAESFARRELAGAALLLAASDAELLALVEDPRRADAAVIDYVQARDAMVRGRLHAELAPVEDRRFTTEHFALAVRQGDADWLAWLNLFLRQHKTSGSFHKLAARYNAWFRNER